MREKKEVKEKEALLYEKTQNKMVRCKTCSHYCLIPSGRRGLCGVRENKDGKLFSLNYKRIIALNIDPVEKKPLYHFLPGTKTLSFATIGCNFFCQNCQNWEISQAPKPDRKITGDIMAPKDIVEIAKINNLPSISYTYTEPTIFLEYAIETMKLAKKAGLKNIWVSNGYFSKETFDMIFPYLDAINIDLKSFSDDFYIKYCGGRLQPVLENLKRVKKKNIWLEITTLSIPTLTDSEKMFKDIASFIKKELGEKTPWHISRFSEEISWKLQHLFETPVETLELAHRTGKNIGLKYVYLGNIWELKRENTVCPKCSEVVIERRAYSVVRYDKNGYCPRCGEFVDLIIS